MKYLITILTAVLFTGTLFAQDGAPTSLAIPRVEGTPTIRAEKGSIVAGASENALWIKAGGYSSNDWTKIRFVPASATLVSGTVTITNAELSTNSAIFLSAPSGATTNTGTLTVSSVAAGGVFTISSIRFNAAATNFITNTADTSVVRYISIQ